jgi:hypothetical protein
MRFGGSETDSDFDEADTGVLAEIIGRLGLADVAKFGLRW